MGYHCDRYKDYYNVILQWRREFRLNSKYCTGKLELIAKKQGGKFSVEINRVKAF